MKRNPDCVYIIIRCADGFIATTAIHRTVRDVAGRVVRSGEIDAGYVQSVVNKIIAAWQAPRTDGSPGEMAAHLPVIGWRPIDPADIPDSLGDPAHPLRCYRAAARDTGQAVTYDLEQAKTIALTRVRRARAVRFDALDADWMKATGTKDTVAADAIEAERQTLRDLPQQLMNVWRDAKTMEEVDAALEAHKIESD